MLQLLQQVKNGIDSPITSSNNTEFLHLERLVNEGYVKANCLETLAEGLELYDARLTSKGLSYLRNKIEPFPLEQTKQNVWTFDRRIQVYPIIISIITLGIAAAVYLKSTS